MRVLIPFLFVCFLCSCKSKPNGIDLMPKMTELDSIEVLYFKTPGNDRFFTYLPSREVGLMEGIVSNLKQAARTDSSCSKEGKIYCFAKGNVFNTLYFSLSDCAELRFIVNGSLYHFPMNSHLKTLLKQAKNRAR